MLSREGKQTDRGAVGAEFIGYDRRRREALLLQEFPHQPNCRPSVPAGLNQEIQDFALTVHGTPEIELPPSNYDDHLVQVPAFGRSWPPTLNPPRIGPTEFQDPSSNCLIRDVETTLGKQVLNVPIAQRETAIQPDGMLDDDRWKAVTTVGYLAHPETLKHRPCRSHAVNVTMPFAALNDALAEQCRRRQAARLRGHKETIGERLERDRQVLLPLPPAPYDACDKRPGRASSLSLVRYRSNDYSVPVAYGHREVLIRGYVDEVVISCGAEVIARHRRSYDSEDLIFDPLHYLPLIEQKIGALDQAAPLAGWDLPEAFITLRRRLEARMGKAGKRAYVQVLRLLETFRLEEVEGAVGDALRLGAIGFDAVKHLVLCRIERRPPRLNLDVYPYLPRARVAMTSAKSYMSLLSGLGA